MSGKMYPTVSNEFAFAEENWFPNWLPALYLNER